jgi:hypothetical protein
MLLQKVIMETVIDLLILTLFLVGTFCHRDICTLLNQHEILDFSEIPSMTYLR